MHINPPLPHLLGFGRPVRRLMWHRDAVAAVRRRGILVCALRLGINITVHQKNHQPLVWWSFPPTRLQPRLPIGSSSGSRALPLPGRLPNRIRPVTMSRSRPSAVRGGSGAGARALSALRAAAGGGSGGGGGAGSGCCCSLSDGSFGKLSTVSSRAAEAAPAAASLSSAAVKRKAARQWRRLVPCTAAR